MTDAFVLTLNVGSSSLKFSVFTVGGAVERRLSGKFDQVGRSETRLELKHASGAVNSETIGPADQRAAAAFLFELLDEMIGLDQIKAVGLRVVHGGARYRRPAPIDGEMIEYLRQIRAFAPEHLPAELEVIEACRTRLPGIPHIACFDTGFHHGMPVVARTLPIPRRLAAKGVERFGFHGLSYSFLLDELKRQAGAAAARGRLVLAHLGNGASLAAVNNGQSVDTSMGFTPAAGVPMGTRSGDLDPGLVLYLAQTEGMDAVAFDRMVNHESGLLGISETSSDMRELLERETADIRAAEALALFCYSVKKTIGAFAAALGGLDTLVFTGGIGENSGTIRTRICDGLDFLGVDLDPAANEAGDPLISFPENRVAVRVIRADEEAVIVKAVIEFLGHKEAVQ
ncbi:acetate/propionate family kinase [Devosia psychrophila]|uniref:Acetate kinase n=1 Tax=Devosia psychrophila TaxID=728005 RepID=A0A0F5PVW3_9HYPH|nr:acetate/propionate family kinase [Devosia psychrophila]KKC32768.1 acetate kinase [Devosia psychrophila]SFD22606.1 acetate kinase [Devosia psychrophila]